MTRIDRLLEHLNTLHTIISAAIILLITLAVSANIVLRWLFAQSYPFVDELARAGLLWVVFLMLPVAFWKREHIVFAVPQENRNAIGRFLNLTARTIVFLTLIFLAWKLLDYVRASQLQRMVYVDIKYSTVYVVGPYSAALSVINFLRSKEST
jgi:TRAP-type C4-dicarboxylate transport system permease small subunit